MKENIPHLVLETHGTRWNTSDSVASAKQFVKDHPKSQEAVSKYWPEMKTKLNKEMKKSWEKSKSVARDRECNTF
jgi:hypothetical protein